ncbi:hypothetical protein VTI74DRAFT_585 [Chaetomium olivicolor]
MTISADGTDSLAWACPASNVESSERAREREIAAYLSAASFPPGLQVGFQEKPALNTDATLNALTQLGALRLGCDRAFISLIDRRYQFVVAEVTRSHSLVNMKCAPDDTIAIGVCKINSCDGVCPATMKAFMDETGEWVRTGPHVIANRTRYIINNFKAHPEYKDRPYVTGYPHFTSHLEVPLVSPLGYLLGSYCVVDSKPNDFDHDDLVEVMNEVASAIMAHLENVRIRQSRDRSEQLIQALSAFIRQEPPLQPAEFFRDTSQGETEHVERRADLPCIVESAVDAPSGSSSAKPDNSSRTTSTDGSGRPRPLNLVSSSSIASAPLARSLSSTPDRDNSETPPTTPRDEPGENPMELQLSAATGQTDSGAISPRSSGASASEILEPHGFNSSANIKTTFFRAADTIRRSMDIDGLMFLDAVPSSYVDMPDHPPLDNSLRGPPHNLAEGPFCVAIAKSARGPGGETVTHSAQTQLPELSLQRFIRAYPNGHVFTADELGPIDDSYGVGKQYKSQRKADRENSRLRNDITALFRVLPAAKYVIFLPLWHFQRQCWYAAVLGWIEDATRAVGVADLGLVSAFGNSVMAEVSRLEALAASRAKSDFVSSLSHELRSPLHGIMASSELLRDAISDRSLLSTLDMLDSCATTLLDTFNNLLDHAIVTHSGASETSPISEFRTVDLGALVEEVVEAVTVGQLAAEVLGMQTPPTRRRGPYYPPALTSAEADFKDRPLLITVQIARFPWTFSVNVGAWKRIVMNIFGNAFKYTRAGRIEVGLKVEKRMDSRTGVAADYIAFTVEDTGLGMSSDYLKYRLFTPFSQEDTHAPGMGLGLSIVRQLVSELGGVVSVKSSLGVGTQVDVLVPLGNNLPPSPTIAATTHSADADGQQPLHEHNNSSLAGRTVCLIPPEACAAMIDTEIEITDDIRGWSAGVERAIRANAAAFLGINVVVATKDCPAPKADVYILDCNLPNGKSKLTRDNILHAWDARVVPLVVLCSGSGTPSCVKQQIKKDHGIHLHPPIGPRKLALVLRTALEGDTGVDAFRALVDAQAHDGSSPGHDDSSKTQEPSPASALLPPPGQKELGSSPPLETPRSPETPNDEAALSPDLPSPTQLPTPPPTFTKAYHLLLVDDNPINLKLLEHLLQKLNHTFATAANGFEAVQLFKASLKSSSNQCAQATLKKFDMVFMDISMPVMNGFEAAREIRLLEKEAGVLDSARCKIVALTGLSSEEDKGEAERCGVDLFLTKPVGMGVVKGLLEELNGGR